ncbi:solute carrier family 23 member 1-like isoform X1 [Bos javanicus]|uniref:solute carrier family 23 member 1-like isoform X1 n=1 Tax=Bos javanicus TaxID=9906 RepID=UPI002AA84B0C|nr:solute carrier family 23 member 1-like isoform X1 [Bos javanicus]
MNSAITTCEHPNPLQRGDGVLSSHEGDQGSKKDGQLKSSSSSHLAYGILDIPPWYLCIFLGIQHFLTALGGLVAVPLILAKDLCLQHDPLTQSYLISTIFFVSGICTLLQVFLGIRLPILQGGTFAFLGPSLAMLSLPTWKCPEWTLNASQVNTSSPEFIEEWQKRIRELQGAVLVASCVQMLVGFSGLIGFLMRFIGPLTIAPTISLMALPLFDSAGDDAGIHWGIAATTIFLIVLFSQYLKNIAVPVPVYGREKKSHTSKFYLFQIFPVLLGLCISWLLCFVLTVTDALPSAPTAYGYLARTDTKGSVLSQAPWFRFPYPGQWGLPTVSPAGVFGIIAAVISSMVESIGDYHACARLVGAPPPPKHAINRGIGIEGLGCLLAGAWGTGNGTTSYSENVGALGITRLQGAVLVASCVQMLVGFSGLIGFLMRFIGPLTIAPTISLMALPLFDPAGDDAGIHWGIAATTIFLIVLFSQYLKNIAVPVPVYGREKKSHTSKFYLFQIFPVLLGLCISWLLCFVLTVTDALPSAPTAYGYLARTDTKGSVLSQAPWFRFPYPGQWGFPTVSLAGVFGIIAGVISSVVESIGDYHACARLVGVPPPPKHAINRGIGIEGLGCLLAGAWGTGNGTTSYSQNVGALGITRVGSRMVIVAAGCVLLLMGIFGKIGAAFVTIPAPVVGGMFLVMFGVITAVGISNLQYVDLNSSRNLFIFGFSIFCGLAIPNWVNKNPERLRTGILQLDQVIQVLLTTGMFVGGFLGFLLDNTIPGSLEERGLLAWNQIQEESEETTKALEVYGLPWGIGTRFCTSSCAQYLPFWPREGEVGVRQLSLCPGDSEEGPRRATDTRL